MGEYRRIDNSEKRATSGTQDEKKQHNTIYVGDHYTQTNTNNVNKTNGGKDDMNIVIMLK